MKIQELKKRLENESKAVQYMRVKCAKSNCREMVDYSTDIVKNHCVNVLIKLNLPQSILYKPIFLKFRIKDEHFV